MQWSQLRRGEFALRKFTTDVANLQQLQLELPGEDPYGGRPGLSLSNQDIHMDILRLTGGDKS